MTQSYSQIVGGTERTFKLDYAAGLTFERDMRKSLYETFQEFLGNRWRMRDAIEIIRLAAVGAGMDEGDAIEFSEGLKDRPFSYAATLATKILEAAFFGKATAEREEIDRVFGSE
ncbi:GTA-gp10 family protein [Aquamicrobium lusatiense]|uniref:GTA-gp10 family protein n=1 Tax=Aquamicrobium lusatiense TaxID=89772 RepID=UPI002456E35B|nr:GTA-gp10 family protein [Aquamicrobium lusatiense]MDH4993312.1 GTA-gp10 family protein [Aquamicrobium lusatiense]